MKCLIDQTEKAFPCSRGCHLFGDCVCDFERTTGKTQQPQIANFDSIKAMNIEKQVMQLEIIKKWQKTKHFRHT